MDPVLGPLFELGLEPEVRSHLEPLSDVRGLRRLRPQDRGLEVRRRDDVVLYLRAWAALLVAPLALEALRGDGAGGIVRSRSGHG